MNSPERFSALLASGTGADWTINLNGKRLAAHSLILRLSSSYFERIVSSKFVEKQKREVAFTSWSPEVAAAFEKTVLPFLYDAGTGVALDATNLAATAWLAEYLGIDALQDHCKRFVKQMDGPTITAVLPGLCGASHRAPPALVDATRERCLELGSSLPEAALDRLSLQDILPYTNVKGRLEPQLKSWLRFNREHVNALEFKVIFEAVTPTLKDAPLFYSMACHFEDPALMTQMREIVVANWDEAHHIDLLALSHSEQLLLFDNKELPDAVDDWLVENLAALLDNRAVDEQRALLNILRPQHLTSKGVLRLLELMKTAGFAALHAPVLGLLAERTRVRELGAAPLKVRQEIFVPGKSWSFPDGSLAAPIDTFLQVPRQRGGYAVSFRFSEFNSGCSTPKFTFRDEDSKELRLRWNIKDGNLERPKQSIVNIGTANGNGGTITLVVGNDVVAAFEGAEHVGTFAANTKGRLGIGVTAYCAHKICVTNCPVHPGEMRKALNQPRK